MVRGLYIREALRKTTMARITPIDVIKGISGKYGNGSSDYFATNSSSNRIHLAKYLNKPMGPATQSQLEQMQKFSTQAKLASAWLRSNRPSTENGAKGTAAYQEAQALGGGRGTGSADPLNFSLPYYGSYRLQIVAV